MALEWLFEKLWSAFLILIPVFKTKQFIQDAEDTSVLYWKLSGFLNSGNCISLVNMLINHRTPELHSRRIPNSMLLWSVQPRLSLPETVSALEKSQVSGCGTGLRTCEDTVLFSLSLFIMGPWKIDRASWNEGLWDASLEATKQPNLHLNHT